jgi:hypothetical protein
LGTSASARRKTTLRFLPDYLKDAAKALDNPVRAVGWLTKEISKMEPVR